MAEDMYNGGRSPMDLLGMGQMATPPRDDDDRMSDGAESVTPLQSDFMSSINSVRTLSESYPTQASLINQSITLLLEAMTNAANESGSGIPSGGGMMERSIPL